MIQKVKKKKRKQKGKKRKNLIYSLMHLKQS